MKNYENNLKSSIIHMFMSKKGKSKISLAMDIIGMIMIISAIVMVKLTTNPLVEIIAGILASLGFGLVTGAKYV